MHRHAAAVALCVEHHPLQRDAALYNCLQIRVLLASFYFHGTAAIPCLFLFCSFCPFGQGVAVMFKVCARCGRLHPKNFTCMMNARCARCRHYIALADAQYYK